MESYKFIMGLEKNERDTIRGKYIIRESTKRRAVQLALKSLIKEKMIKLREF